MNASTARGQQKKKHRWEEISFIRVHLEMKKDYMTLHLSSCLVGSEVIYHSDLQLVKHVVMKPAVQIT